MAQVTTFMLSLVAQAIVPFDYGLVLSDPNIGLLYLFAISLLGVRVVMGAPIWSPMVNGPIGQKWLCAAGVERSTLHRCGLTGLGLINLFFIQK